MNAVIRINRNHELLSLVPHTGQAECSPWVELLAVPPSMRASFNYEELKGPSMNCALLPYFAVGPPEATSNPS
jgi:hypothetical protein